LFKDVWRSWWLVLLCGVVAGLVGYQYASSRPILYSAQSSVYFKATSVAAQVTGSVSPGAQDADRRQATNTDLMQLPAVATRAARELGKQWTTADVQQAFTIATGGQSDIVRITATDETPEVAARIADAVANAAISYRADATRKDIVAAAKIVHRQVAKLSSQQRKLDRNQVLLQRDQQLRLLVASPSSDAILVQRARVPRSATTPSVARGTILGIFLGLLLGTLLAFARGRLDRRIRDERHLLAIWQLPVLAVLPRNRAFRRGVGMAASGPFLEPLASARASIRLLARDAPCSVIGVASAVDGEGKSTVAWNLCAAVSATGVRTLLIEGDLREPSLVTKRGVEASPGLVGVVSGDSSFKEAVRSAGLAGEVSFDVLPAGERPPLPLAILSHPEVRTMFDDARSVYDFIVVDSGPVTMVPDPLVLSEHVDGLVAVARLGTVRQAEFSRLASLLDQLAAPTFGLIVNDGPRRRRRAYGAPSRFGRR
jgi:capsular exopolysaccharide synthesis family protein